MTPARARIASTAVVAAVVGFWALEIPAMLLYPGGTWWDATTRGARFWQNYLCDLEWRVALDGLPNELGSRFAQAAMLVQDLGMLPFWWLVGAQIVGRGRLATWVRALGTVSVSGTVAVAFLPSDRFAVLHAAAVLCAAPPGLAAAILGVTGLVRMGREGRAGALLGGAMLAAALLDFTLYTSHVVAGTGGPPFVAATQKVALLFLQAWMLATAAAGGRRSRDLAMS